MRPVKLLSTVLGIALIATAVTAKAYDRFGKGALSMGATPPGVNTSGGSYVYSRQYVQPAPVVATAPVNNGRRAFSVAPSTVQPAAPAVAANPPVNGRRAFSVEPLTTQTAAPAAGVTVRPGAVGQQYNRFGKGPTTIGLTPPGVNR
jgi:hypothetical protein